MTLAEFKAELAADTNMSDARIIVQSNAALMEVLQPRAIGNVWKWLEENTYLGERQTATPGRYSTSLTPYLREPLNCFGDRSVTDITMCFGTQCGKSVTLMGGAAFRICNDPMPTLWVFPNLDLAKSFSQNRWMPYVDDCAPLRAQKPTGPGARTLWKKTEQYFSKVTLKLVGSNSAANIASHPAGFVIMDETDKFEAESDKEAGALDNAEERTKSFPYPLRCKASTPTTIHGQIWGEFLLGDQRYYHMPCPHCEREITFQFPQLKWWIESKDEAKTDGEWDVKKVRKLAHYQCQECDGRIYDRHKTAMLESGRWIPLNPNAEEGRRSYHLNSLYAPWKECMFGAIAVKWIQSSGSVSKRHRFINSWLAEPWDEGRMFDDKQVTLSEYDPYRVASKARIPVMAIDFQEKEFWAEVRAFHNSGESWMLWAGKLLTEEDLIMKQREFGVDGRCVAIDMAKWPNKAAQIIVRNDWRGLWGSDKRSFTHTLENGMKVDRIFSPIRTRDPYLGTAYQAEMNRRARWAYWCNHPVKDMLEDLRFEEPNRYHVLATAPVEYQRHLNAEIKAYRENRRKGPGWREPYYKLLRKENHLRDTALMAIVIAVIAGLIQDTEIPFEGVRRLPGGEKPTEADLVEAN